MEIQQGYSYHIKDEFFDLVQDKYLMSNKERAGIVPCDLEKTEKFCKQNYIGRLVFPCWM